MQGEADSSFLTEEETLEFVTPHALNIKPQLIGIPLAKPWKRFLALGIDVFLISLLSSINVVFLVFCLAVLFFYISSGKRKKGSVFPEVFSERKRKLVRRLFWFFGLATLALTVMAALLVWTKGDNLLFEQSDGWEINRITAITESIKSYGDRLRNAECKSPECMEAQLLEIEQELMQLGLRTEIQAIVMEGLRSQARGFAPPAPPTVPAADNESVPDTSAGIDETEAESMEDIIETIKESEPPARTSYSLIGFGKDLMNDLGIGLGWSSLYFTLFTSFWKGKTPGKLLLRIRVIQLNDTPLSLWESFGRYGGYAAGISTGLLGFLQVFWDPNRQAIQDKISATVVVDLSKPKHQGINQPDVAECTEVTRKCKDSTDTAHDQPDAIE